MTEFTPVASLCGGALIGIAAVFLLALNGRIAGISGIVSGLLPPYPAAGLAERVAFVAGLIGAPILAASAGAPIVQTVSGNLPVMTAAGLLVGFGATWGSGCTSGHGVCGLSRLSPRSLVATLTFMATGIATVGLVRHVLGG